MQSTTKITINRIVFKIKNRQLDKISAIRPSGIKIARDKIVHFLIDFTFGRQKDRGLLSHTARTVIPYEWSYNHSLVNIGHAYTIA